MARVGISSQNPKAKVRTPIINSTVEFFMILRAKKEQQDISILSKSSDSYGTRQ